MKIRRYNGKTLRELCDDEDYQEMIKPYRKSWSGNIFHNISNIRRKWIIDFKSCPWQDLVRMKMIRKEGVTSPMVDKLINDCLSEVKCRVKKKELTITVERS